MYGVPIAGTIVTDVIARIQCGRITVILNETNETNVEKEDSLIRLWQNNTTNGNNATADSLIIEW